MTTTNSYRISNAYGAREWIRSAGGKWNSASKVWILTADQYASLVEDVETSGQRSNKRDRALFVAWQGVTVTEVHA